MTESISFLDKYRPVKVEDIVDNKSQIILIENFMKKFKDDEIDPEKISSPTLIITGPNGVGKTLTVDLILEKYGFSKIVPDMSNVSISRKTKKKKAALKDTTMSSKTIKTYYLSLQSKKYTLTSDELKKRKIVAVFDDVSNISNPKEKEAIKSIVKLNSRLKKIPIIIISNTKHSKTMNELKKMVAGSTKKSGTEDINEVIFTLPNYAIVEKFVKTICKKEGLNIIQNTDDDDDIYYSIIDHSQYDIRRLLNILEELKLIYGKEKIDYEKFKEYSMTSKTKDLDPGIYEATRILLNDYRGVDYSLGLYAQERATVPLMVHQNYPMNIRKQYAKMDSKNKIDIMFNISKCISDADYVDGIIYANQSWSLQPVHGFYSCVMPSFLINSAPKKSKIIENYEYTKDYNKTSIKKINNKVIKKAQENPFLKNLSIPDFLYISAITKTLCSRKDYEKIGELFEPYGITATEIESIIKIDKVMKTKNNLTGKQKSLINDSLKASPSQDDDEEYIDHRKRLLNKDDDENSDKYDNTISDLEFRLI